MNKFPLLSIIIPVYNAEEYLDRALNSLLHQEYKNIEIILINDGSKDRSGYICEKWAKQYPCIKTYHKQNGGASSARNIGLNNATGEFITFLDADDCITSDTYSKNLNLLISNPQIDIVQFPLLRYINKKEIFHVVEEHWERNKDTMMRDFHCERLTHSSVDKIYRKTFFDNIRFKEGCICEDILMNIEVVKKCNTIFYSESGRYIYSYNDYSVSHQLTAPKIEDWINALIAKATFAINFTSTKYYAAKSYMVLIKIYLMYLCNNNYVRNHTIENRIKRFTPSWNQIFISKLSIPKKIISLLFKMIGFNIIVKYYIFFRLKIHT